MAVSLVLTVTESSVSQADNTSKVTAVLKAKSTNGSYNNSSKSGYITIDGTKYSFSHSFAKNTTTTLATKSKTVTHNADGTKSITVKGYYQTGVSSGNISKSVTKTLTHIIRQFTVAYNANGGTGAPASQTKNYGTTLTLSSAIPTRTGYVFKGWSTSASGAVSYQPGGAYTANAAVTLYAIWELAFKAPVIQNIVAYRTNASNQPDDEGKNVGVSWTYTKAQELVNGVWVNSTQVPVITLTVGSYTYSPTNSPYFTSGLRYAIENEYPVTLKIAYTFQGQEYSATKTTYVSRAVFTMDVNAKGSAVAFGRSAPDENNGVWQGTYLTNVKGTQNLSNALSAKGLSLDSSLEEIITYLLTH